MERPAHHTPHKSFMAGVGLIGGVMKWRDWYLILIAAACLVAALWVARALVGGVL